MRFKFKNHKFTLMFIPHNNSEVKSIKIPAILINSLAVFGLISMIVVSVLFIKSANLEAKVVENDELKIVNSIQSEEIKALKEDTQMALEKLEEIRTTDAKVREMVGLKVNEDANISASRDSGGMQYPSSSFQTESYDLMSTTYSTEVSLQKLYDKKTYGLSDIEDIRNMLSEINEGIEEQEQILSTLEKETTDRIKYLAAIPQGKPSAGRITSVYGWRSNPFTGRGSEFHSGVDIASSYGTRIAATGAGKVTFAGYRTGFGYTVVINHGYGYTTTYAHCSSINVRVGQQVERGTLIARMGSSGRSTGPHVHYEISYNGKTINPQTTM